MKGGERGEGENNEDSKALFLVICGGFQWLMYLGGIRLGILQRYF